MVSDQVLGVGDQPTDVKTAKSYEPAHRQKTPDVLFGVFFDQPRLACAAFNFLRRPAKKIPAIAPASNGSVGGNGTADTRGAGREESLWIFLPSIGDVNVRIGPLRNTPSKAIDLAMNGSTVRFRVENDSKIKVPSESGASGRFRILDPLSGQIWRSVLRPLNSELQ